MNICIYNIIIIVMLQEYSKVMGVEGGMCVLYVEYKADSEDDLWAKISKTANLDIHIFLFKLFYMIMHT